jgi:hypothetical protein
MVSHQFISIACDRLTAGVTGAGAGVYSLWEQNSAEAWTKPKKIAQTPQRQVHTVLDSDADWVGLHVLLVLCTLSTQPGADLSFCPRNRLNCAACSWT